MRCLLNCSRATQALALALWSFARMGSGSPGLLETAAACAEQQLEAFTPPQLAKVGARH